MTPEKGNAPQALAGERGAIAKRSSVADVSVTHTGPFRYPDPFDPTALALAQMVVEDRDRAHGADEQRDRARDQRPDAANHEDAGRRL